MLTSVYGASEYSQAFSRIGSLFGNTYIINAELEIKSLSFKDGSFESVSINYNDTPIFASKGLIVGCDYQDFVLKQLKHETPQKEV